MARVLLSMIVVHILFVPVTYGWYLFDKVGCHVTETTGMCGYCAGGCWPYFKHSTCAYCAPCTGCDNGHKMDELCRCTDECPLGKWGSNCDRNCEYKCRACDRHTGQCTVWCSPLCLDTCHLSSGYCRYNMTALTPCGNHGKGHCQEYSRYSIVG